MKKYEQFQLCLAEVSKIEGLNSYHTIFLATMVLRKTRHPEEGLREVTAKTMRTMEKRYSYNSVEGRTEETMRKASMKAVKKTPEQYGKTDLVVVSLNKCLDELDMALEEAYFPKEMEQNREGENVKFVFDYLTEKVNKKMIMLAEEA